MSRQHLGHFRVCGPPCPRQQCAREKDDVVSKVLVLRNLRTNLKQVGKYQLGNTPQEEVRGRCVSETLYVMDSLVAFVSGTLLYDGFLVLCRKSTAPENMRQCGFAPAKRSSAQKRPWLTKHTCKCLAACNSLELNAHTHVLPRPQPDRVSIVR